MGMSNAGSFDVNTACAGFVTAIDMAAKYIKADENYNNILVIGAYAMSKYLNMSDKKNCYPICRWCRCSDFVGHR